jgi:hypothetical protein
MLCPKTWALKRTKSLGIESQPSSTKRLGFQPKSFNRRPIRNFRDHDQAQRCTRKLSMIPSNKFEPKHLKIEGTRSSRKSNENSSKEHEKHRPTRRKSMQPWKLPYTRMTHSLHSGQENLRLWSGNEKQSRRMICPKTLELIYISPSGSGKWPSYPYHLSCDTNTLGANRSCSTPLHRTTTPSPQSASSWRKPCDPATCPPASKLLGAPRSRLHPPSLRSWFCGSVK